MQYASAIYWGGDLIAAPECDYESYRNVGTICPYCGSAVHLVASSEKYLKASDRTINARAYFAHFKAGSDGDDCEARSVSKYAAADREQMAIAAKNQRLKLFNNRLWDLLSEDRNINRRGLKNFRQGIGGAMIGRTLPAVRKVIADSKEQNHMYFKKMLGYSVSPSTTVSQTTLDAIMAVTKQTKEESQKDMAVQSDYFSQCNQRLHVQVCNEVMDVLATKSGGYCLERIIAWGLCGLLDQDVGSWLSLAKNPELDKILLQIVLAMVSGTHWGDAIAKYAGGKNA